MIHARKLLVTIAAAAVLAAAVSPALAAPAGQDVPSAQDSAKKLALTAKLEGCTPDGYATFTGSMPAVGRGRMEMRFDLQQRGLNGRRGWTSLKGIPSFGVWDGADPGVPGFIVRKRVGGLATGSSYRAVVKYRWRNPRGRVVRGAKRTTAPCVQRDTLPDLDLRNPDVVRGSGDGAWTYRVTVVNQGAGAAGASELALSLAGGAAVTKNVPALAAGERLVVEIGAPRCAPGTGVKLTADAAAQVAESNEANNVIERRCGGR